MRILWWSCAPWCGTGYGSQTRAFLGRLERLGHALSVLATYGLRGSMVPASPTVVVFPSDGSPFAQNLVSPVAERTRADLVVSLGDVWPLSLPVLEKLQHWCPWTPIDTTDCPPTTAERLRRALRPIAMSRAGQAAMARAGLDSSYVPHAYDEAEFFPVPQPEARAALGWPTDRFVASIVAGNSIGFAVPNRKCFDEQMAAFAMLREKHDDALLYVHSKVRGEGAQDLGAIARRHDLAPGRDVVFPDPVGLELGLPPDYLRLVYSASDALLSVTAGEGFGVPCVEAQACGTPIVGGDWSATAELVGPGWRVDKADSHEFYVDLWRSTWRLPRPAAIAECLERAYSAKGDAALRQRCAEFAAPYEADRVTETYWRPLLAELAGERGSCDAAAE